VTDNYRNIHRVALSTVGCKVNQYETELLQEQFREAGFRIVSFKDEADLYLINSCTVTKRADQSSIKLIKEAKRRNKKSRVVVTGCYAEAKGDEIKKKFPWVDLVVGNRDKLKIVRGIQIVFDDSFGMQKFFGSLSTEGLKNSSNILPTARSFINGFDGHNRAFVKIEDGCNVFCAYCKIPYVRGSQIRSRSPDEILQEVKSLAENGFKEIVLTGINLGLYGRDLSSRISLVDLLRKMEELPIKMRIRLSSLEPHLISSELIDLMASSSRICRHLHLPLQSGDVEVLKRMGRKYTLEEYRELLEEISRKIPSIAITTDVMVGFPGEEERHFQKTLRFLEDAQFSRLHVFRFSPREGTRAFSMRPRVDERIKRQRSIKLRELGRRLSAEFITRFLGERLRILIEDRRDPETDLLCGYTDNYIRVFVEGDDDLKNKLVMVKLIDMEDGLARGEVEECR